MAAHAFANVYLQSKPIVNKDGVFACEANSQGCLYENGILPTSVVETDLPPWYVSGWLPVRCLEGLQSRVGTLAQAEKGRDIRVFSACERIYGYVSARGVKELLYIPWYAFEETPYGMDSLFVSYDKPIEIVQGEGGAFVSGHDCVLSGGVIVPYVHAASRYGDCDTGLIEEELLRKADWRRSGAPACYERVKVSTRMGVRREWMSDGCRFALN